MGTTDVPGAKASAWGHMFQAPRDAAIRLHLPAFHFDTDEHGRPKPETVRHAECVGIWDAALEHWVNRDTGAKVFPSGWKAIEV